MNYVLFANQTSITIARRLRNRAAHAIASSTSIITDIFESCRAIAAATAGYANRMSRISQQIG